MSIFTSSTTTEQMLFKILLVNQRKMMRRLVLILILYFSVTWIFLTSIMNLHLSKNYFIVILIAWIFSFPILLYLKLKPTYHREVVLLNEQSVSTLAYGIIDLKEIISIKFKNYNASSGIELILNNGLKLIILPSNQFSSSAREIVRNFYLVLINNYNQMNSILISK